MSLLPLQFTPEVGLSPEWAELHRNWAALIRLAGLEKRRISTAVTASNGEDEREVTESPTLSSQAISKEGRKVLELTMPVKVCLPEPMAAEDMSIYRAYVGHHREQEMRAKLYIALIFEEYRRRKSIEKKFTNGLGALLAELTELQKKELPFHVRNALAAVEEMEEAPRQELHAVYDRFILWVEEMRPQWIATVYEEVAEKAAKATARKAAMEAAKVALADELAMGRQLSIRQGSSQTAGAASEPSVGLEVSTSQLRRKAIEMLESEEEEVRRRRDAQLQRLRTDEEAIKSRLAEREQQQHLQDVRQKEEVLAQRYHALLTQESELQTRLRAREEERRQREEDCRNMLDHVTAEEQLLRQRLKEREDRRIASAEEAARIEAKRKAELYEHLQAEEELVRRRMQKREEERETQLHAVKAQEEEARRRQLEAAQHQQAELEERIRRSAAQEALQREQEEAMRVAKERHLEAEREAQLRYLKEQEEELKARMRKAAVAEIKASEQHRQTYPVLPLPSSAPPLAPAAYSYPTYPPPAPPTVGAYLPLPYVTPSYAAPTSSMNTGIYAPPQPSPYYPFPGPQWSAPPPSPPSTLPAWQLYYPQVSAYAAPQLGTSSRGL